MLTRSCCATHVRLAPPHHAVAQVVLVRDLASKTRLPLELQNSNALIMTVAQAKG